MSDRYPIDDLFKDRFSNHEPALPADAWEKLQAARAGKKHRGALPWWRRFGWAILLLITISAALVFWIPTRLSRTNLPQPITNQQTEPTANPITRAADAAASTARPVTSTNPTTNNSSQETNLSNGTSPTSATPSSQAAITTPAKAPKTPTNQPALISNSTHSLSIRPKETAESTVQQSNTVIQGNKTDRKNKPTINQRRNPAVAQANQQEEMEEAPTLVESSQQASTRARTNSLITASETEDATTGADGAQRNYMSLVHALVHERTNLTSGLQVERKYYPPCPALERDAAANKQYLEWYVGPDLGLKTQSDTGNSAYLQKRRESTQFLWAFSAGFRYTRVFQNGVSFRTGINFSQITERFRWVQANYVQVNYTINPTTGDTTGTTSTRGTRYKTTYNRFRSIDVPLLLGYETGFGKFKLNAHAGALVNMYGWQRGEVLDTALRPVSITTGKGSPLYQYRTNLGIGLTGGVSFYYGLNDNWQILAEPYFRYNLTPMSREGLTYREKYNVLGLRIGLRRNLW